MADLTLTKVKAGHYTVTVGTDVVTVTRVGREGRWAVTFGGEREEFKNLACARVAALDCAESLVLDAELLAAARTE